MKPSYSDRVAIEQWASAYSDFDVIIDARSEKEFYQDHLPGAMNLPVVKNDEYAQVGTLHKTDTHQAYLLGVRLSMVNISKAIDQTIQNFPRGTRVLVYCFRGGKRSKLWLDALTTIGFKAKRLEGGWKAYRAWVRSMLEDLPGQFQYNVLCGPTGCGKTRLLDALRRAGEQVLDLEAIAKHRGSLIGYVPGIEQPSQKLFDSQLLAEMRALDPSRPVWVEAESKKIGDVSLPLSLFEAIHNGTVFRIEAPMTARVHLWREDYGHFEIDPNALLSRLKPLRPLVGGEEFDLWERLTEEKSIPQLFERLMTHHYDLAYKRSILKNYPNYEDAKVINLSDLSGSALDKIARDLLHLEP